MHVQQLNCCVKKRQTFLRQTCGLQTAQFSVLWSVDYEIWAVMQHRVYHRKIRSVDDLKRQLIDVWCGLNSRFLTRLLSSGKEDIERVCILKEDISSTACELTMLILSISVTFNVTCLTVTSLITTRRPVSRSKGQRPRSLWRSVTRRVEYC